MILSKTEANNETGTRLESQERSLHLTLPHPRNSEIQTLWAMPVVFAATVAEFLLDSLELYEMEQDVFPVYRKTWFLPRMISRLPWSLNGAWDQVFKRFWPVTPVVPCVCFPLGGQLSMHLSEHFDFTTRPNITTPPMTSITLLSHVAVSCDAI